MGCLCREKIALCIAAAAAHGTSKHLGPAKIDKKESADRESVSQSVSIAQSTFIYTHTQVEL